MTDLILRKHGQILIADDAQGAIELETIKNGVYKVKIPSLKISTEELRRSRQNRTYWGWITDLEKTKVESMAGTTKEQWHERLKFDYLVKIYIRDDKEYALMFSALEIVLKEIGKSVYENLRDGIIKETSTTRATVAQFSEYLKCVEQFAHGHGVVLRTDPKVYKLIFGGEND
jgi:hypothetical protein